MALFINRGHYLSASTVIAELAQIDSLPGSHIESAVSDRNGKTDSEKGTLSMCWHIVRSFHGVLIVWLPFLYHVVQYGFHIRTHVRIVVLVD